MVGVFAGIEYTEGTSGTGPRRYRPNWVTGTSVSNVIAYVWDNPDIEFDIQADGSVPAASIGKQADLTNFTSGSTLTGLSQCTLGSTLYTSGTKQLRIVDIPLSEDNAAGDAYTIVRVQIVLHQYRASIAAF
jgi:hypothetical protein